MTIGRAEYTITELYDGDNLYQAWANSADGSVDFSTTDSNRLYMGTYTGLTPPKNSSDYKWIKVTGENAIIGSLSNDSHQIGTDADGNHGNYYGANSTLTIFNGGIDDTSNWNLEIKISPGESIVGTLSDYTYTVTDMKVDDAHVTFIATPKIGEKSPIIKVFSLSKNKQGIHGDSAVNYHLSVNNTAVKKYRKTNTMEPNTLEITGTTITGLDEEPIPYSGYFEVFEQSEISLSRDSYEQAFMDNRLDPGDVYILAEENYPYLETYRSESAETDLVYTMDDLINTMSIKVRWYKDSNFTKLLDVQTIIVSSDGLSTIGGHLTNDNITFPADESGKILNIAGNTGSFIVYEGMTNVTTSAVFAKVKETNIALNLNTNTGFYTVTGMTDGTDTMSGSAVISATYDGVVIEKEITVSKAIAGENATSYWLTSDVSTITKHHDGTFDPKTITFKIASQRGNGTVQSYAGKFLIETSNDGISYTKSSGYPTSTDSSVNTFTVPSNVKFIRATAYKAGGTTETIDVETIPVLQEVIGEHGRTVSLTSNSGLAFIYDSKTSTRSSQSVILSAQAINTKGAVYYQFLINGSELQNNISTQLEYSVPTKYSDMPVSVQVNIREGSGSGTILASDTLTLMGLKAGYSPIKGSDYYDGVSYTVMLSKETHNFVGVTGHAVTGGVTSKVIAHKSIGETVNQVSATIGTITGIPTKGVAVSIEANGSQNAQIVIKVTEELTEDDNQLVIPITVDGVQFYKTFSFGYTQKVDGIEEVLLLDVDYQEGTEIYTTKANDSVVHVEMDGQSYQDGEPTPDYPVEIHNVNDFDVVSQKSEGGMIDGIEIGGRNLYIKNLSSMGWVDSEGSLIGTVNPTTEERASHFIPVESGDNYTFSLKTENTTINPRSRCFWYDKDKNPLNVFGYMVGNYNYVITVKAPQNAVYVRVSASYLEKDDSLLKFEKGNKVTDWTPAPEDITEDSNHPLIDKINLSLDEPLRSVGDVKDRLFRDGDGLWKVERNIGEIAFDGSESWWVRVNDNPVYSSYLFKSSDVKVSSEIISNRYTTNHSDIYLRRERIGISNYTDPSTSIIVTDLSKTSAEWTTWLSENPLVVLYELAGSIIETLPQTDQSKLNNFTSFSNSNYIYTILPDITNDTLKENLQPNLKATFKSYAWYKEYKHQLQLETIDRDIAQIENLSNSLYNNVISAISDGILTSNEVSNIEQLLSSLYIEHEDLSGQYQSLLVGKHTDPELSNQLIDRFSEYNTFYTKLTELLSSVISSDSIYLRNTITGLPKDRDNAVDYQYTIEEDPLYLQKAEEINEKFISYRSALRALTTMMTNMIYGYINKGIKDLEITDYVRTSDFDIVADSITANISQSGGHNYIRNSTGWNWSTDPLDGQGFWTMDSGSASNIRTDIGEIYNSIGTGSAFRVSHTSGTTSFSQQINLPSGIYSMDGYIMNSNGNAEIIVYDGAMSTANTVWRFFKNDSSGRLEHMDPLQNKSFNITRGFVTIRIAVSGSNVESFFSGLMLKSGEVPSIWTPHPAESYNANVRTDINGIKVFHSSNLNDNEKPFTRITPLEFAGYDYINGSLERVFTLNGDTTEVINLKVKNHIDIGPIRFEADDTRGLVIYKNN